MDPKYVGQIERAKTNPSINLLANIASALDISLPDLFMFSPEKYIVDKNEFGNLRVTDLIKGKSQEFQQITLRVVKALIE
ncbi:helix-turn-helix domain-containing protein [bacterium]|nr:helix-turn-helix domain-containing protein [bacterium]